MRWGPECCSRPGMVSWDCRSGLGQARLGPGWQVWGSSARTSLGGAREQCCLLFLPVLHPLPALDQSQVTPKNTLPYAQPRNVRWWWLARAGPSPGAGTGVGLADSTRSFSWLSGRRHRLVPARAVKLPSAL